MTPHSCQAKLRTKGAHLDGKDGAPMVPSPPSPPPHPNCCPLNCSVRLAIPVLVNGFGMVRNVKGREGFGSNGPSAQPVAPPSVKACKRASVLVQVQVWMWRCGMGYGLCMGVLWVRLWVQRAVGMGGVCSNNGSCFPRFHFHPRFLIF